MIPSNQFANLVLFGLALTACATVTPAQMAMPNSMDPDIVTVPIIGIGAGRSGQFSIGQQSGNYHRSADRLALFDQLLVRNTGHVAFRLAGPNPPNSIDATCKFGAASSGLGAISVDHSLLRFDCRFSADGKVLPHSLSLNETRDGVADTLMRRSRQGTLIWGDRHLTIKSVHRLMGSPLQTATPMGYSFQIANKIVGAVSLANKPIVHITNAASESDRQAVVAAAVALALFWDPAETEAAHS